MPNIVPVDATALPKSSRRAALGLFAGLSALVATPAIVRAATPSLASAEDAELFALAEPIAAADAALEAVNKVHSAAEDAFFAGRPDRPTEPPSPDLSDEDWLKALRKKTAEDAERGPSPEWVAYKAAVKEHEESSERLRADCGLEAVEQSQFEADEAVIALRDMVVSIPATTLAGLIFKARYAAEHYPSEYEPDVMISIVDDLLALGEENADF
jgi:hypothetical protein